MTIRRQLLPALVLATATALAACGKQAEDSSATRPDPAGAREMVLETAELILSKPDFDAACENISAERRSGLCTEDVRSMAQAHLMDEGLPFDKNDVPDPETGKSGCVLKFGDGSMPVFGSVTVAYTGYAWEIDTIENLARQQGQAAALDEPCPTGLTNPE